MEEPAFASSLNEHHQLLKKVGKPSDRMSEYLYRTKLIMNLIT